MNSSSTQPDAGQSNFPTFYNEKHISYIKSLASKLDSPTSYEGAVTEHLRMSGIYWSLTALSILCPFDEVDQIMGVTTPKASSSSKSEETIVDWVFSCYDQRSGGFGGNKGLDGHILYTLSAIQILALADSLSDPRLNVDSVCNFITNLQLEDGSFAGDEWGEVDTRFSYCALSSLSILGRLIKAETEETTKYVDVKKAAEYILSCQNFDGGFGSCPGAESHAGQIFCCIGALSITSSLHLLHKNKSKNNSSTIELLGWWLAERQCDSGGLNGRPEKQADVCYSWWILSSLSIMGKVDWINIEKLASFILKAQDDEDGGIADRPDDMVDVFHTFFGIAGLSLIGYLHKGNKIKIEGQYSEFSFRKIDPVYALPTDVVERLQLTGQVIPSKEEGTDSRLEKYGVYRL